MLITFVLLVSNPLLYFVYRRRALPGGLPSVRAWCAAGRGLGLLMMMAAEVLLLMSPGLSTGWFWGVGLSIGMEPFMRWSTANGPGSLKHLAGKPALDRLTRAADETAARLGADHRDSFRARIELAHAYLLTHRFDEGIALQEQTIEDWSRVEGADHPDVLQERANLALAYRMADRRDKSLKIMRHVAADTAARFGPDHPRTRGAEQVVQQWTDTPG